jgi:hypothetical protein
VRLIRCDSCGETVRSRDILGPDYAWIAVEANEDADHGEFCSWTCLAAWATNRAIERESWQPVSDSTEEEEQQ